MVWRAPPPLPLPPGCGSFGVVYNSFCLSFRCFRHHPLSFFFLSFSLFSFFIFFSSFHRNLLSMCKPIPTTLKCRPTRHGEQLRPIGHGGQHRPFAHAWRACCCCRRAGRAERAGGHGRPGAEVGGPGQTRRNRH